MGREAFAIVLVSCLRCVCGLSSCWVCCISWSDNGCFMYKAAETLFLRPEIKQGSCPHNHHVRACLCYSATVHGYGPPKLPFLSKKKMPSSRALSSNRRHVEQNAGVRAAANRRGRSNRHVATPRTAADAPTVTSQLLEPPPLRAAYTPLRALRRTLHLPTTPPSRRRLPATHARTYVFLHHSGDPSCHGRRGLLALPLRLRQR